MISGVCGILNRNPAESRHLHNGIRALVPRVGPRSDSVPAGSYSSMLTKMTIAGELGAAKHPEWRGPRICILAIASWGSNEFGVHSARRGAHRRRAGPPNPAQLIGADPGLEPDSCRSLPTHTTSHPRQSDR